jgi:hypothetical protein
MRLQPPTTISLSMFMGKSTPLFPSTSIEKR